MRLLNNLLLTLNPSRNPRKYGSKQIQFLKAILELNQCNNEYTIKERNLLVLCNNFIADIFS